MGEDITRVMTNGFSIENPTGIPCEDFINNYFRNFNIAIFLSGADSMLSPFCATEISKKVIINDPPPKIGVEFYTKGMEVVFGRDFYYEGDTLITSHSFFSLPEHARDSGIAREVL